MSELKKIAEFIDAVDPLAGPNLMKYVARNFIDNGEVV